MAEARILVRPDTSRFRADLEAQLASAVRRPIQIPVVPVAGTSFAASIAATAALTAAQQSAAAATTVTSDALATATTIQRQYAGAVDLSVVATESLSAAQTKEAAAAAASAAAQKRMLAGVARGAGASALTLFGLRGATLAASGAFLAGTAAVVGFSKAVQSAASLETELNVFRVTAGATADEMDRAAASAKELGRDITLPGVTAGSAAEAFTELAKAGLSVQDSLTGARGALELSTAAQIDVKDATNLVAGALNAFQLSGTDAVKVADLLTGAAKESQGEITDMATALGQAAAVSHLFGVSIQDTVTLLTELSQAGIAGGRAGTSLRVAFLRLVNPPADAAKALKELNVQIRDAQGNLRPQIFSDITEALQGYTKAQQQATLATIFGADAVRTAAIIGNRGTAAFLATRDAVTEAGLAQKQAAARTQGLQGDIGNLQNQVQALGLTFGELASGPTKVFVKTLAETVSTLNDATAGVIALAKAQVGLEKAVANSIPFLDQFGKHISDIAKVSAFFNPLTAQLKVLSEASKRFGSDAQDAAAKTDEYGNAIDGVTSSLGSLNTALLQSAADSKINTEAVTSNIAALQQSAADSRIDFSKLGQTAAPVNKQLQTKQIENIIGGFNAQEVKARIAGNNAQLIAVLQQEQTFLENQLKRQFVKNRPELQREINNALLGVVTDLRSLDAQAKARNDALKSAAQRVADERKRALEEAAKKIRDAQAAAAKAAKEAAAEQQRQQEQQRQDLLRGLDLNIEFAQITDNQKAEVIARNKKIAELNRELKAEAKAHGRTTLLYKELRNEIAAQTAAINEITKEKQKQNVAQSFAKSTFDFLQAQQGFASNLLGNLIPGTATAGVVGGSVQSSLAPQANAAEAAGKNGPTAGQGNATNHILTLILQQLKHLNGSTSAPEAGRQMAWQRSTMDYHSG